MKKNNLWKRGLASLLTLGLLAGSAFAAAADPAPVSGETVPEQTTEILEEQTEAPESAFYEEGAFSDETVLGMEDAAGVVAALDDELVRDERTRFEPWRTITDSEGNNYYVFRQMYGDVTVSGGAIKVVTDASGSVLGVVSSVEAVPDDMEAQEEKAQKVIGADEAQTIVTEQMEKTGHPQAQVLEGHTQKVILPVNLELDPDLDEDKQEVRFVWAVYTNNDGGSITGSSELPYLAHYVTTDGEYLYSLPTIIPDDEAGSTGFQASYVFEFMEPATYTGTVTLSDGREQEISVTLMRDSRTGMYYLGNLERRIVVADCYEFLYQNGNVVLEASADNTGWDNTCLLSLYNYCKAWDYYNEIGWKSPDGLETPIIILKDYCDKTHMPVDNAAYAGKYYGWQVFLSSSINDYSQCLDVLAHEYTHGVTGSVMTYNAYMNDFGAINEAISDIQGNICEMYMGATEDTTWELGEQGKNPVRSMSDPHKYGQPEFAWDVHYRPNVKTPTEMNDRGGVHANSSLLNQIAYLLCSEGGMSFEDARSFWFAVDCSMVPGTDYAQLSELMPWVMKNLGYDQYLPTLEEAIEKTRIRNSEIPSSFEQDRALVKLTLPETETFEDGNWALFILSADVEGIRQRFDGIINREGEYAGALDELKDMLGDAAWKFIFADEGDAFSEAVNTWLQRYFKNVLHLGTGSAGQDGRTIQLVCSPGYTVPLMLYMKFEPNQMMPSAMGITALVNGEWKDILSPAVLAENPDSDTAALEDMGLDWLMNIDPNEFFCRIEGGKVCELSAAGLEQVGVVDRDLLSEKFPEFQSMLIPNKNE